MLKVPLELKAHRVHAARREVPKSRAEARDEPRKTAKYARAVAE